MDITVFVVILALAGLIAIWSAVTFFNEGAVISGWVFVIIGVGLFVLAYNQAQPEAAAKRAESEAQRAAEKRARLQPRVIREVDGCKVYAFEAEDRWKYFTRCPNSSTTTESDWIERHGKTSRVVTENIEVISK